MLWRAPSRTREVRTSQATATPTPNAGPKPPVTCSWIRPAPIAGATKSCAPAPAASAPTAGRARDAVKDRHSLGRRAAAHATRSFHALRRGYGARGEVEYHRDIRFAPRIRGPGFASAMRDRGPAPVRGDRGRRASGDADLRG